MFEYSLFDYPKFPGDLGNGTTSLILLIPVRNIIIRAKPGPYPAWGSAYQSEFDFATVPMSVKNSPYKFHLIRTEEK